MVTPNFVDFNEESAGQGAVLTQKIRMGPQLTVHSAMPVNSFVLTSFTLLVWVVLFVFATFCCFLFWVLVLYILIPELMRGIPALFDRKIRKASSVPGHAVASVLRACG